MTIVRIEDFQVAFGAAPAVLDRLSLELRSGEFFCLLGPSGSGKSTLLRAISGELQPGRGRLWIGGEEVTNRPAESREIGMVYQSYALFPHLSAEDNVAFPLRVRGVDRRTRRAKAKETLRWVGLSESEARRYSHQLSGGQQQRVALARALVFEPKLLMLDEPFANLDRNLRERLRDEVREITRAAQITTVLVTHDREEAYALSDRIGVILNGRLMQVASPRELHRSPQHFKVAQFLGHPNLFAVESTGADFVVASGLRVRWEGHAKKGDHLIIHPERINLCHAGEPGALQGVVHSTRFLGRHATLWVQTKEGPLIQIETLGEFGGHDAGQVVGIRIEASAIALIQAVEEDA